MSRKDKVVVDEPSPEPEPEPEPVKDEVPEEVKTEGEVDDFLISENEVPEKIIQRRKRRQRS